MSYEWPGTEAEKKIAELIVAQTGGHFVSIVTTSGGERVSGTERLGVKAGKGTIEVKALLEAALSAAEPSMAVKNIAITADINNGDDNWIQVTLSGPGAGQLTEDQIESALTAQVQDVAVAEIVSAHGDPEAFGERELVALVDIQKFPYRTKLYAAAPAKQEVKP